MPEKVIEEEKSENDKSENEKSDGYFIQRRSKCATAASNRRDAEEHTVNSLLNTGKPVKQKEVMAEKRAEPEEPQPDRITNLSTFTSTPYIGSSKF